MRSGSLWDGKRTIFNGKIGRRVIDRDFNAVTDLCGVEESPEVPVIDSGPVFLSRIHAGNADS